MIYCTRTLLLFFFICGCYAGFSQRLESYIMDEQMCEKSLIEVLEIIQQKHPVKVFFTPGSLDGLVVSADAKGKTLPAVLESLFLGTSLNFIMMHPDIMVIIRDPEQALRREKALQIAQKENRKIKTLTLGDPLITKKKEVVISGQILDVRSGDPIANANIQFGDQNLGTTSDEKGNFSIVLPSGLHVITISLINYESQVIDLAAFDDGIIRVSLEKSPLMLDELVFRDESSREIRTTRIGQSQLVMLDIKRSPSFMGQPDLVRQVQTLPGVTTVGEAATGFNVRGGSVDQNLILFDGLPVFNSGHAFGFFSAFNPDVIRDVSFIKGGIPAEYGGRVSSVMDIITKDGDYEKWNGTAGIGLITGNMSLNGPLMKDKTSLAMSFRSTYSNWLIRSLRTDYINMENSSVFFYDATLKLAQRISDRSKLSITGYSSKDAFSLVADSVYQWHNLVGAVRFDHQFSDQLSAEFVVGTTVYGYRVENLDVATSSELAFRISANNISSGFHYESGRYTLNFGWQLMQYVFQPGYLKPLSEQSNTLETSLDKQFALENAWYISTEWSAAERLFIEGGLRLSVFSSYGPAAINQYKPGVPREITSIVDTLFFDRRETIKTFVRPEPRLSIRWMTGQSSSLKMGYNRMYQYLHLVTNTAAVTPIDIWQPSGYFFKPQHADQVSVGYFTGFKERKYDVSAELFYKSIRNIIDFKDGARLTMNRNLETELLQGKGYSYGIETSISKNTGRLTGSVNYTYSRAFRKMDDASSGESINRGKEYPANFDQPHIINFSWKYNLSRRHYFTGNFTYHSGRPITIPLSVFAYENTTVAYFSERNQYRIPDYHRLDLAFVIEGNHRRGKRIHGTWFFSFYNVYARKNPYTIFFKSSGQGIPSPYQLSIVGTVLPSLSYNLKF